jgi:hypothetical protein
LGSPPALHASNNQLVGYGYDANGNMTTRSNTYDVANRLVSVKYSPVATYSSAPITRAFIRRVIRGQDPSREAHQFAIWATSLLQILLISNCIAIMGRSDRTATASLRCWLESRRATSTNLPVQTWQVAGTDETVPDLR